MNIARTLVWENKGLSVLKEVVTVILASLLLALSSKISIPLFPVPITLQNSLILFFGVFLGSRRATAIVLCFLAQTVMGFSVLSSGSVGLMAFFGPTGGYLMGYLFSAFLTGWLMEKYFAKTAFHAFFSMLLGNLLVYCLGAGFLSTFVGIKAAFWLGIAPFLFGDFLKLLGLTKLLQHFGWK